MQEQVIVKIFVTGYKTRPPAPVQAHRTAFLKFSSVWKEENSSVQLSYKFKPELLQQKREKPCRSLLLTDFYFISQSNLFRATYMAAAICQPWAPVTGLLSTSPKLVMGQAHLKSILCYMLLSRICSSCVMFRRFPSMALGDVVELQQQQDASSQLCLFTEKHFHHLLPTPPLPYL